MVTPTMFPHWKRKKDKTGPFSAKCSTLWSTFSLKFYIMVSKSCRPNEKITIKMSFQWNGFAEWPFNGMVLQNALFNFPDCK